MRQTSFCSALNSVMKRIKFPIKSRLIFFQILIYRPCCVVDSGNAGNFLPQKTTMVWFCCVLQPIRKGHLAPERICKCETDREEESWETHVGTNMNYCSPFWSPFTLCECCLALLPWQRSGMISRDWSDPVLILGTTKRQNTVV